MSLEDMLALLLKLGADEDELRDGIALYDRINNTTQESHDEPDPEPEPAVAEVMAASKRNHANGKAGNGHRESCGHSTRRASILPLQDWMGADAVGERLGLSADEVIDLVARKGLAKRDFGRNQTLYHVRQVAYWLERNAVLSIDPSVFDGWVRQSDAARQTGVRDTDISYLVTTKQAAVFRPLPRLVLVNEREVASLLKSKS